MQIDQDLKYKSLEDLFTSNVNKLSLFVKIADESFPKVQKQSDYAVKLAMKAKKTNLLRLIKSFKFNQLKQIWRKINQYKILTKHRKGLIINILNIFRKYQIRSILRKWNAQDKIK